MGVPYKRSQCDSQFQARRSSQSRGRALFSRWFQVVLRAPDLGGVSDARAWNKHQFIQRCTTQNFRERIGELPQTEHFNRGAFVKKCFGGIAPNRLEAHRSYTIVQKLTLPDVHKLCRACTTTLYKLHFLLPPSPCTPSSRQK
jgi:hypothetical protein